MRGTSPKAATRIASLILPHMLLCLQPPISVGGNRPKGSRLADPLARFAAKCAFDPVTGCVIWIGAQTQGRGKTAVYGAFSAEGKTHRAHVWAAKNIHGQEVPAGYQVDHCCEPLPNTLCVQHVQSVPASINRELQWIRVQVGLEEAPPIANGSDPTGVPFHSPPDWLRPYLATTGNDDDSCPF